jgi:hypothetical protein
MKGSIMGMYDNYDKDMAQKGAIVWMVFIFALALTFIILKLTAVIAWGWLWVLAPIWGPLALGIIMALLGIKPPQ